MLDELKELKLDSAKAPTEDSVGPDSEIEANVTPVLSEEVLSDADRRAL